MLSNTSIHLKPYSSWKFQSKKMYPLISVTRNTHNAWGKLRDGISMQFVHYVKRFIRLSYWESQCLDRMMGICCSALLNEVNFLILLSNIYTNNLWNVEMPFTPLNLESFFSIIVKQSITRIPWTDNNSILQPHYGSLGELKRW